MACDGHIVVVDQDLDVQRLCHRQPRGLGVVAFHLAAVGTQQDDRLAGIGHGDAVHERPQMPEAAGAELHSRSEQFLRMPRQAAVEFAVVQQPFRGHGAVQDTEQILSGHAVAGFIVEDGNDRRPIRDEGPDDHELGNRVVRTARVPGQTLCTGEGRKEHDRVARQLDVLLERSPLLIGQRCIARIQLQRLQATQINRKAFGRHCGISRQGGGALGQCEISSKMLSSHCAASVCLVH